MATNLAGLDHDRRVTLVGGVLGLLNASPFRRRATWPSAVVVWRPGEHRVTSRGDLAGFFYSNDLRATGDECIRTRAGPGQVLVWLEADGEGGACAGFVVIDVVAEGRALRAG